MSNAVRQFVSKGRTTATSIWNSGSVRVEEQYVNLMKENAKFVVNDPAKEQLLLRQWFFTKMSKIPVTKAEAQKEYAGLKDLWAKRGELSLQEVGTGLMFSAEVFGWFCIGEILGRGGNLIGYNV
ncbi:hypothetical protein BSKO_11788 [Bryopsis sp. KO-2023]|nr:hypothetical protein BSKO_11788 [Bryopsis sp. KO-2023]